MVSGSAMSSYRYPHSPPKYSATALGNKDRIIIHYSLHTIWMALAHGWENGSSLFRSASVFCFQGQPTPFLLTRTNMFALVETRWKQKKKKRDVLQGMSGLPLTLTLTLSDPAYPCSLFSVLCSLFPVPWSLFSVPLSPSLYLSVHVYLFWFVLCGKGKGRKDDTKRAPSLLLHPPLVQNVMRTWYAQSPNV